MHNIAPNSVCDLLPGANSEAARSFVHELFRVPRFAHHPTCRCYDAHLLRLGRMDLCLGCSCAAIGGLIAIAALNIMAYSAPKVFEWCGTFFWVILGVVLYLPTLAQPFVQLKPFKIIARCLLGTGVILMWFGAIVMLPFTGLGILLRIVFILVFCVTYRITQRIRTMYARNPCSSCAIQFPLCEGNRERLQQLVDALRSRLGGEHEEFLQFATRLTGISQPGPIIEIVSIRAPTIASADVSGSALGFSRDDGHALAGVRR